MVGSDFELDQGDVSALAFEAESNRAGRAAVLAHLRG
jgi:hypothetical protein